MIAVMSGMMMPFVVLMAFTLPCLRLQCETTDGRHRQD